MKWFAAICNVIKRKDINSFTYLLELLQKANVRYELHHTNIVMPSEDFERFRNDKHIFNFCVRNFKMVTIPERNDVQVFKEKKWIYIIDVKCSCGRVVTFLKKFDYKD